MFGKRHIALNFYRQSEQRQTVPRNKQEAKIIVFASQKGGTGKTTTAQTLAACFTMFHGQRVLGVDLDPQGCFGAGLLRETPDTPKTADRLLIVPRADVSEYVIPVRPRLDLIPNHFRTNMREALESTPLSYDLLRRRLQPILPRYDYIIVDTPAGLSRSTQFGLDAADQVVLVLSCGKYALQGAANMLDWLSAHSQERRQLMPDVKVILNNFDERRCFDRDFKKELEYIFGADLMRSHIRPSVKIVEAAAQGITIMEKDEKNACVREFKQLSRELLGLPADATITPLPKQTATRPAPTALRLVS